MTAAHPELVVMAAGVGSRFGGLKQLEPVGPGGEKLIDYSIFDALRAGVERVVFVIRREMETDFHALVGARFMGRAEVVYAHQELDDVPAGFVPPAGRTKPWGTAHAILAARQAVRAPFLVINADDFYGAAAYGVAAGFLRVSAAAPPERWAMVGYHLANTLSAHGAVSRGVCAVGAGGLLRDIVERPALEPCGGGARETGPGGAARSYPGDTPVSMNFWAFTPAIFPHLKERFARFLETKGQDLKSEFYIPAVVKEFMDEGLATVSVLDSPDPWFGLTYREDRDAVAARLRALVARGDYPPRLWG
jgi:UTP-glucose-1-phosphate uridylyltransferase